MADHRTLSWSVINTPHPGPANVIVSPCEINAMAPGPDNQTIYCVDTANSRLYRSSDTGYTWNDIGNNLLRASALLPAWNIAIAPDDVKFVLAVTDKSSPSSGPGQLYFSDDGGANWYNTNFPSLGANEYISCLDISGNYGATGAVRDIAVGTRISGGGGRVFACQYNTSSPAEWREQSPLNESISSIRFSPNYDIDYTIAAISSTASNTRLNLGYHSIAPNTTSWNNLEGWFPSYPIIIQNDIIFSNFSNLIRTSLELPDDFLGSSVTQRSCFASILTDNATNPSAVVFLNVNLSRPDYDITPPVAAGECISSIAYNGSESTGILLAGEVNAMPGTAMARIWQCSNPQTCVSGGATWILSNAYKSPTGGGTTNRANTLLMWSVDGQTAYCGTSSENSTLGGTSWSAGQWPFSKLTGAIMDESAFSRSNDNGMVWNQTGLIDTEITRLSDVAVHELPEGAESTTETNILYLASLNENPSVSSNDSYDSVWRSISSPLGDMWERILIQSTSNNDFILRINPRGKTISKSVALGIRNSENITCSVDMGQSWVKPVTGMTLRDMCYLNENTIMLLDDYAVGRMILTGSSWIVNSKINTGMEAPGHTIYAPVQQPLHRGGSSEQIVLVGTKGNESSYAGWINMATFNPKFNVLKKLPVSGDVHIITDSQFENNRIIYAAVIAPSDAVSPSEGIIYRWQLDASTDWSSLDPANRAFYGAEMLNDVLYGAWYYDSAVNQNGSGVDRTLYPRVKVPPPPEWDDLTAGLPAGPFGNTLVKFTREPVSLHVSSGIYNTLWAIDDREYDFDNSEGCLWSYIDSAAKVGPWPISPPTGSFTGTDPVSGRSQQIDYKWRQLIDMKGYDLLIAKDVDFTLPLRQNLNFAVVDNNTGAWIVTPADWLDPGAWMSPGLLESGRSYYWRVRGSIAISGEIIHSPWSPVMFFSVRPGFIVESHFTVPTLLSPVRGPCMGCKPPISFSWTPVKEATKYEFLLAADPELTNVVTRAYTTTTSYKYTDNLEYFKPYYWRVRAIAPVSSDPSPVATFSISDGSQKQIFPVAHAVSSNAQGIPAETLIWVMISLAYLLILLIIIYAFISRRG